MDGTVAVSSRLAADPDAVWARAVTPAGINHELAPWLRMTMPRGLAGATIDTVAPGVALGRSWILLFGVVPVDFDDLRLEAITERGFRERSSTAAFSTWVHERAVTPCPGGCEVSDRLAFDLRGPLARVPGAARLAAAIVGALFRHRHRRLRAFHGVI